jgi:hypothetical protein
MINKVNAMGAPVYIKQKKQTSIPDDLREPVARSKQDEEKDQMYNNMAANSQSVIDRFSDDDLEDDYHASDDTVPMEDQFVLEDESAKDD